MRLGCRVMADDLRAGKLKPAFGARTPAANGGECSAGGELDGHVVRDRDDAAEVDEHAFFRFIENQAVENRVAAGRYDFGGLEDPVARVLAAICRVRGGAKIVSRHCGRVNQCLMSRKSHGTAPLKLLELQGTGRKLTDA